MHAWRFTERLWRHRFSRRGPCQERWIGLYVPLDKTTGLANLPCTWAGVFAAEAVDTVALLLLSDTDVAPTALFEVAELVQLGKLMLHSSLYEVKPGIIIGTEPHLDINAGLTIFPGGSYAAIPGSLLHKVKHSRQQLLSQQRRNLPHRVGPRNPVHGIPKDQMAALLTAAEYADAVPCAALTKTPLAGLKARAPRDYLNAWTLLGTWTCARVWPTPTSGKWPKACLAATDQLKERHPYLGAWARSSFEQGALCALAAMSSESAYFLAPPGDAVFQCHGVPPCVSSPPRAVLPLVVHYYGCKDNIHELHRINALPTLPQSLLWPSAYSAILDNRRLATLCGDSHYYASTIRTHVGCPLLGGMDL